MTKREQEMERLRRQIVRADEVKLSISVDTFNSYKLDSYAAIDKAA